MRFFLLRGFSSVYACDLTPKAVELTKKSISIFNLPPATIEVGNAENLSYPDNFFDHVNCQGVIHHTPDTAQCIKEFHRILKPGGTVCFSVYYKNFILRSPVLLKICSLLSKFIKLHGRGREYLLQDVSADEIVRRYDGIDNPIGKSYTKQDIFNLLRGLFTIEQETLIYFPARAMPFSIPKPIHKWASKNFGFMIVLKCRK